MSSIRNPDVKWQQTAEMKKRTASTSSDGIIEIPDSSSSCSDYGTGTSSPITDKSIDEIKPKPTANDKLVIKNAKRHQRLVYANVHHGRNSLLPWRVCRYKKSSISSTAVKSNSMTVLIDSDTDDEYIELNEQTELNTKTDMNTTQLTQANTSIVADDDIVNLDSDDDEANEPIKYHIVESKDSSIGMIKLPEYCIAKYEISDPNEVFNAKWRVIAQRSSELFPYTRDQDKTYFLYTNDNTAFFAGIISDSKYKKDNVWHYLIFFDDGFIQYVEHSRIRLVFTKSSYKYSHQNLNRFCEYYFTGPSFDKTPEMDCNIGSVVQVYVNGAFNKAYIVNEFKLNNHKLPTMFQIYFDKWKRYEWIYSGSPRFELIWKHLNRSKSLDKFNPDMDKSTIELSSDSEDDAVFAPSPKKSVGSQNSTELKESYQVVRDSEAKDVIAGYKTTNYLKKHVCSNQCVIKFESNSVVFQYAPLDRPILSGWQRVMKHSENRRQIEYITPCGRRYLSMIRIQKYLIATDSRLTMDCFSLDRKLRCLHEKITLAPPRCGGVSTLNELIPGGKKERMPIRVISVTGDFPKFGEYVMEYHRNPKSKKVPSYLSEKHDFRSCCDCTDNCSDKTKCSCWQLTFGASGIKPNAFKSSELGYANKRLLHKVSAGIYECNSGCKCNKQCTNRVVTRNIETKLEIFETIDRGYGVRTQTDLPKGSYICAYFGDLLHGKTADARGNKKNASSYGDEYFLTLDHIEMKDGYESDVEFGEMDSDSKDSDDDDERPSKKSKLDVSHASTSTKTPNKKPKPNNNMNRGFINYFPTFSKPKETRDITLRTELYGNDEEQFVVDGRVRGNISRFFNHSCDPNCFTQVVFIENHDLRFPYLALFTSAFVRAGTELTWDYSYQIGTVEGRELQCRCGSPLCRGRLL